MVASGATTHRDVTALASPPFSTSRLEHVILRCTTSMSRVHIEYSAPIFLGNLFKKPKSVPTHLARLFQPHEPFVDRIRNLDRPRIIRLASPRPVDKFIGAQVLRHTPKPPKNIRCLMYRDSAIRSRGNTQRRCGGCGCSTELSRCFERSWHASRVSRRAPQMPVTARAGRTGVEVRIEIPSLAEERRVVGQQMVCRAAVRNTGRSARFPMCAEPPRCRRRP
ncbi:hypothetical protein BLA24064_00451 [Burkholderia latens]|uniref:Uncharacterized protein n=1 Tax=Burkholderia latens TaxID=488446 RepID=A0A6P2H9F9_9BURK|nr:hypothetical protein BLA24064_00451 [Burkholderia latens]